MRRSTVLWRYLFAPSALGAMLYSLGAHAADPDKPSAIPANAQYRLVRQAPAKPQQPPVKDTQEKKEAPSAPAAPAQPSQPPTTDTGAGAAGGLGTLGGGLGSLFGGGAGAGTGPAAAPATGGSASQSAANASVGGAEAAGRATSDAGDLLGRSQAATGVEVQRRNPITTDPRVRGYHVGEIFTIADGAFFTPARLDLDTVVSKIDSNSIRNATVIKGPYSVRYGPGLVFIDIETLGTQRYERGWEGHGSTSLLYKTNGDQWRGRQSFWGGSTDWGFRIGYDIMAGSDYDSGNGTQMPSSYNSQNLDFAFGYDFSPNSRLEIKLLRQDIHDVEFPGQVFDINRGITDSYIVNYTLKNQEYFDKMTFDAWYNYTRFNGDDFHPSKLRQIPQLAPPFLNLRGFTDADVMSPGFRNAYTWGQEKCPQLTIGVDMRYLSQHLNEYDTRPPLATETVPPPTFFNNPIPRSHSSNPGIFVDAVIPVNDKLTIRGGVRGDFVDTDIDHLPPGPFNLPNPNLNQTQVVNILSTIYQTTKFDRQYNLFGGFVTGEYKVNEHLTPFANFGVLQRPPTLTELYAAGPFLAVVQNGLNNVIGNPALAPEQSWQMEVGLRANYERFRGGVNLYYAWIHNYITYQAEQTRPVQVVRFVNTDQASLSGFEVTGEYDLYCWLTPFANMNYVEGRDRTRDHRGSFVIPANPGSLSSEEPLPGIPPLDMRLGLRFHEAGNNPRWGVETTARIVLSQGRIAESLQERNSAGFTVFDIRTFWQANKNLLLTAGIENVLDRNYREHLDLLTGTVPVASPTLRTPIGTAVLSPVGPGVLQPGINFYFGATLTY